MVHQSSSIARGRIGPASGRQRRTVSDRNIARLNDNALKSAPFSSYGHPAPSQTPGTYGRDGAIDNIQDGSWRVPNQLFFNTTDLRAADLIDLKVCQTEFRGLVPTSDSVDADILRSAHQ
jgi:hypothetical protein